MKRVRSVTSVSILVLSMRALATALVIFPTLPDIKMLLTLVVVLTCTASRNIRASTLRLNFDARVSEVTNYVIPYFEGVNEAFSGAGPKLRIGCYGSGAVNTELLRRKLIDLRWITCSLGFRGSRAAVRTKQYELWQTKCDKRLLGIDVDFNVANVKDWGQFIPFSKASAIRKRGAGAQVHRRSRI